MQITLQLDWSDDDRPVGVATASDGRPDRPFSGRLELLAALEDLCAPRPIPTEERRPACPT